MNGFIRIVRPRGEWRYKLQFKTYSHRWFRRDIIKWIDCSNVKHWKLQAIDKVKEVNAAYSYNDLKKLGVLTTNDNNIMWFSSLEGAVARKKLLIRMLSENALNIIEDRCYE